MNALEISNLSKTYKGGVEALKGISLTVAEGDFFALLGPNGAGKSTTIGIITSLVRKSAGLIKIFDVDIDTDFARAKSYIGVVPQEFNFNEFRTVKQEMLAQAGYYGLSVKEAKVRSDECLALLELAHKKNKAVRALSGGMKRRLMIARALLHKPKMLILDEPTAGIDIEARRLMWGFLRELNESGTTIILTTHYLEEAESLCRNIAIIDCGCVVKNTDLPNLLRQLDRECFILYLETSCGTLPSLTNYVVKVIDEMTLEVEVPRDGSLTDLLNRLDGSGVKVKSMRNKSNRLEELFLQLTH